MHLLLVKYVRVVELDVFGVQELLDRRMKRVGWGRVGERHLSVLVVLVESKYSATVLAEIDDSKRALSTAFISSFMQQQQVSARVTHARVCRQLTPPLYHRVEVEAVAQ
jgi:hypothetical protein